VDVVKRDPFWRDPKKSITGHFSLNPRDVVSTYSPEMARLTANAIANQHYDLVVASIINAAPYAIMARDVPCVLEEHNFMTSWMEERYRGQTAPLRKVAHWLTWQKCRRYERWLYPQFNLISMVSRRDRQAVEETIPHCTGRVEVIPNGVDILLNRPGMASPQPDTLVFNGSITYYANEDAIRYFLSEILPLIQSRVPKVNLKITGKTDGFDLKNMKSNDQVIFTGFLEDVRPVVAASWACIVPLRIGGGTRLKILEAMALGTPVISTSKGAEGLEVIPEQDILIADTPVEFAEQTVRLLKDPNLRERLIRNARRKVEEKYSWAQIGERFCQAVENVGCKSSSQIPQTRSS